MSIIDDIKKGTDFEVLGDGKVKVFSNRKGITTPLKALDTLIGGCIPFGSVVDLFGPPASGKSSYGYECMGHFQREYPEGVSVLIDTEASVDTKRMRALGVDPDKLLVLKGATLEKGYKQIISILKSLSEMKAKERVPVFILWDSLSSSTTEAQLNRENVNGGGIAEAPRINKEFLKQINVYLETVDVIVVLINQVSAKIGMFVGSGYNEAGGNALKHEIHYKIEFSDPKVVYENGIAVMSNSTARITKSKLSPTTQAFPFTVDVTKGGVINQARSMLLWDDQCGYITEKVRGNTYQIMESFFEKFPQCHQYLTKMYPKFTSKFIWERLSDLVNEDSQNGGLLMDFLVLDWAYTISDKYVLQREVIRPLIDKLEVKINDYVKNAGWDAEYKYTGNTSSSDEGGEE